MDALTFNSNSGTHIVFIDSGVLYDYTYSKSQTSEGLSLSRRHVEPINHLDMSKAKRIAQSNLTGTIENERVIEIYPATYNPRISRVNCNWHIHSEEYKEEFEEVMHQSALATKILLGKLNDILKVISPDKNNFHCYGHEIRNLLLLASMEVESAWTAILNANGYTGLRLSTNDYVKLLVPLYLSDVVVMCHPHKSLQNIEPFSGWDTNSPTQSLPWYHAYNETKHDRENNLSKAELGHAINAVAAAIGLLKVQFGEMAQFWHQPEFNGYHVHYAPKYRAEDLNIPFGQTKWTQRNLF